MIKRPRNERFEGNYNGRQIPVHVWIGQRHNQEAKLFPIKSGLIKNTNLKLKEGNFYN